MLFALAAQFYAVRYRNMLDPRQWRGSAEPHTGDFVKKSSTQDGKHHSGAAIQEPAEDSHAAAVSGKAKGLGPPASVPDESSETQRLTAALARLSLPIVVINARHLIVTVNPAIGTLSGYRLAELKGKPVSMLIAERDRQKHDEHIRIHTRGGVAKRVLQHPCRTAGRRADGREFPADATVAGT